MCRTWTTPAFRLLEGRSGYQQRQHSSSRTATRPLPQVAAAQFGLLGTIVPRFAFGGRLLQELRQLASVRFTSASSPSASLDRHATLSAISSLSSSISSVVLAALVLHPRARLRSRRCFGLTRVVLGEFAEPRSRARSPFGLEWRWPPQALSPRRPFVVGSGLRPSRRAAAPGGKAGRVGVQGRGKCCRDGLAGDLRGGGVVGCRD